MFDVWNDASLSRLIGRFEGPDDALAAMRRNSVLVLPAGWAAEAPLRIDVVAAGVVTAGGMVDLILGPAVETMTLSGPGTVRVWTEAPATRVTAGEGTLVLTGGAGRDIATGGAGADLLSGGAGDDVLRGGGGDDILLSGTGRDQIAGGDGDDILIAHGTRATLTGGAGADDFVIDLDRAGTVILSDFDAGTGDRMILRTAGGDPLAGAVLRMQDSGQAVLTRGGAEVLIPQGDVAAFLAAAGAGRAPAFDSLAAFLDSGIAPFVDSVRIDGRLWHRRAGDPPHDDHKAQDADGNWWSPDYLVVVAAGQSNMVGAGSGGDMTLSGNVAAWDWVNGAIIAADYAAAPAGGDARSGTALRNTLYFPFAEALSAAEDRPVLVIARPVSGSRIDTWLETGAGTHWHALEAEIARALAAAGQAAVDVFLWHQGESDWPMPVTDYRAAFEALLAQVRGADWAGAGMDILVGELSRLGVNAAQNAALQAVEIAETDPDLAFVSSVGLTAMDASGVHFDGPSLVAFGLRYFAMWQAMQAGTPPAPNSAPTRAPDAAPPAAITLAEGEDLTLALAHLFADAEGDALWFYGHIDRRGIYMTGTTEGGITLSPGYDAAGRYVLTVTATDGQLDGAQIAIALTVTDAAPGVAVYTGGDFATPVESFATLARAIAAGGGRGIDILRPEAIGPVETIAADALTLRGAAGLSGAFLLGEGVLRLSLAGEADFAATGHAGDNRIIGNAGANALSGGAGRDHLDGGAGADVVAGGAGDDRILGGAGDDILSGGTGADVIAGGAGADVFLFAAGDGRMTVQDYGAGDLIRIAGLGGVADGAAFLAAARAMDSAGRAILDFGTDRIVIDGMTVAQLQAGMFDIV